MTEHTRNGHQTIKKMSAMNRVSYRRSESLLLPEQMDHPTLNFFRLVNVVILCDMLTSADKSAATRKASGFDSRATTPGHRRHAST